MSDGSKTMKKEASERPNSRDGTGSGKAFGKEATKKIGGEEFGKAKTGKSGTKFGRQATGAPPKRTSDQKRSSLLHHWAEDVFELFARETPDGGLAIPVREVPSALQAAGVDTKHRRDEARKAVAQADLNSSGDISLLEFETVHRMIAANDPNFIKMMKEQEFHPEDQKRAAEKQNKQPQSKSQKAQHIEITDANDDEDLQPPHFLRVCDERNWNSEHVQAISAVFGAFDPDGDDVLTYEEAKEAFWWVTRENDEIMFDEDENMGRISIPGVQDEDALAQRLTERRRGSFQLLDRLELKKVQKELTKTDHDKDEGNEDYELAMQLLEDHCKENNNEVDFLDFALILSDLPVSSKCHALLVHTAMEQAWSREDIRDLFSVFQLFDFDGGGSIDCFELMSCFQTLGVSANKDQCMEMIAETDKDGSGCIDFIEFLLLASGGHLDEFRPARDATGARQKPMIIQVVRQMNWEAHQLKDFKKIFESFDIDGDGTVTVTEMMHCFRQIRSDDDAGLDEEILQELDKDGSDDVDFVEFLMFLSDSFGKKEGTGASAIRRKSLLEAAAQHASSACDDSAVLQQFAISIECLIAEVGVAIKELPVTFLRGGGGIRKTEIGRKTFGNDETESVGTAKARKTQRRTCVGGTVGRASRRTLDADQEPISAEGCAERLVNCIQRVLQNTRNNALQEKLQKFVLDFCTVREVGKIHWSVKPWRHTMDKWYRFSYNRNDLVAHEPTRWAGVKRMFDSDSQSTKVTVLNNEGDTVQGARKNFDTRAAFPLEKHQLPVLAARKQMRFVAQHCEVTQHQNVGALIKSSMALRSNVVQEQLGTINHREDFKPLPQELKKATLLSTPASKTAESLKKKIHEAVKWETGHLANKDATTKAVAKDNASWRCDSKNSQSNGGSRGSNGSAVTAKQKIEPSDGIYLALGALQCAVGYSGDHVYKSAAASWKHQEKVVSEAAGGFALTERREMIHSLSEQSMRRVPLHVDRRFGLSAHTESSSVAEDISEVAKFEKELADSTNNTRGLRPLRRKTYMRDLLKRHDTSPLDLIDTGPPDESEILANKLKASKPSEIEIKPCFSGQEDHLLADEIAWQEHFNVSPRSKDRVLIDWRRKAADYVFMRHCWHQQVLPKGGPRIADAPEQKLELDLKGRMCCDAEALAALEALEAVAKENKSADDDQQGPDMHAINMSGNRLTGATLNRVFSSLELRNLVSLDLSKNLGMFAESGELGVSALSEVMARGDLSNLTKLSLDSVRHSHWIELGSALIMCSSLATLSLADTSLGNNSEEECVAIANAVQNLHNLTYLDISNNFLRMKGCQAFRDAIKTHPALEQLLLAGNAGGFASSAGQIPAWVSKIAAGETHRSLFMSSNFSHSQGKAGAGTFAEGQQQPEPAGKAKKPDDGRRGSAPTNKIEGGREASKGSYPALLILCEAFAGNDSIKLVDLTSCQLRYSAAFVLESALLSHPCIETLIIQDNPFGPEGLECILRLVTQSTSLQFCDVTNLRQGQILGGYEAFYARNPGAAYNLDMSHPYDRAVLWRLLCWCWQHDADPETQIESLSWDGPKISGFNAKRPSSLVTPISSGTKNSEKLVMPRWQLPTDGHVALCFLAAIPLESPVDGRVVVARDERIRRVKVTLKRFVSLAVLWKMLSTTAEQQLMLITAIRNTVMLKKSQLKYFALHTFPELLPRLVKDIIPCLPNLELSSVLDLVPKKNQQRMVLKEIQKWIYFNPSNPTGRYSLDLTRTTDYTMGEHILLINSWHRFIAEGIVEMPDLSQNGDGENFRNTAMNKNPFVFKSHGFQLPRFPCETTFRFDYVSPLRPDIRDLCMPDEFLDHLLRVLEDSEARIYDKAMVVGSHSHKLALEVDQLRDILKLFPIYTQDLGTFDSLQAAVEELDAPRAEVFVLLFVCVADRPIMCSPEILYNADLFPPAAVRRLWERLGRLRTFDLRNVCQIVSSNLGNVYDLHLTKYEEHKIAQIVLKLGCIEDGENLVRCWYSEVNYLSARALDGTVVEFDFLIPATWLKDMPRVGQLRFTYQSEKPEFLDMDARENLGDKYLAWSNIDRGLLEGTLRTNAISRVRT